MAYWRESFNGNRMSKKWVTSRVSTGGQNDGVWTRDIIGSKLFGHGVNFGTETGYWGELFVLPVTAPGDIIVEALVRQKVIVGATTRLGVGFGPTFGLLGAEMYSAGGINVKTGRNSVGTPTAFPGLPSKDALNCSVDQMALYRIVRKNGYISIYIDGLCFGQYAYTTAIPSVHMALTWYQNGPQIDKWVHSLSVWPREAVL